MPQRAGAKGSITGTTVCLPRPALQHNLGASARDSSKWLPGAWRALTCSPGLLLGPLIASLLRVGQSFPPECPACPTAASGKKHSEQAECCDWVQRGTKTQAELSSYSKAMHTSVSKYQLQQHAAFPSSYCHGSYNPTPHQTRVCPGLWTPPGSSTFRWTNVPEHPLGHWPKEGDKLVSTPLHPALRSSRLLLTLTAQQQKTSAMPCSNTNSCSLHRRLRIILLWPPSSSSLWSAHPTPQLAQGQAPLPPIPVTPSAMSWPFSALSWCIRGTVPQPQSPESSTLQTLSQKASSGARSLWHDKVLNTMLLETTLFFSPPSTGTQGAKSLTASLFLDVGRPSSAFAIEDVWHSRQASSWHLVTFQALCFSFHPVTTDPCQET